MKLTNYILCKSQVSQMLGLMFSRKKTLVFEFEKSKKIDLHMWFVFYPIDVLFLDKKKKIIEIKRNFRPFTVYWPKKKSKYVVEVPLPHKYKAELGRKIEF